MRYLLGLVLVLVLTSCSKNDTGSGSSSSQNYVKVFTTAPVVNAVVSDDANQTAVYDPTTRRYNFAKTITYPVTVTTNATTYVDVDYDGNKTAADLQPVNTFSQNGLKSFCQEVNFLTNLYYTSAYQDANVSIDAYKNEITTNYGIDICADPTTNEKNAKTLFGAYNYVVKDGNLTKSENIQSDVTQVEDFFTLHLSSLSVDKIKYFSFYNALVWLDAQKVSRSDTIHKPQVASIMRDEATVQYSYTNLDARDLYTDDNHLYVAAAHDEFAQLDKTLSSRTFFGTGDLDAFGLTLFEQTYNNASCLFLSNKKDGILPFELSSSGATQQSRIYRYFDSNGSEQNITNEGVLSTNGFVSISENKRFFAISTEDKGFYLINAKDIFTDCNLTTDINSSTILVQGDTNTSIASVFRTDGSFVYVANKNDGIYRYDLRTPTQADINSSTTAFSLQNGAEAYNLLFYPNSNELLVTTDQGLQIYDVGNDENLSFTNSYKTEGSKKDYMQQVEMGGDFVILSDGSQGIKILKLDSSYTPMLCGVEYFADANDPSSLQRTTSITYDNGILYVGLESGGVVSYRLSSLLFRHCQN